MLAWLLAVLIVCGNMFPPGYAHAHVDGDVNHNHRSQYGLDTAEAHRQHVHPHRHPTRQGDTSEATAAHVHAVVLLFELTIPVPKDDDSAPFQSERHDLPALMRVVDQYLPSTDVGSYASSYWVKTSLAQSIAATASNRSLRYEQPTAASVLLCDTARLERTGVRRC